MVLDADRSGFRVYDLGCRVSAVGCQGSGFRVEVDYTGYMVQGLGFKVECCGRRVRFGLLGLQTLGVGLNMIVNLCSP